MHRVGSDSTAQTPRKLFPVLVRHGFRVIRGSGVEPTLVVDKGFNRRRQRQLGHIYFGLSVRNYLPAPPDRPDVTHAKSN